MGPVQRLDSLTAVTGYLPADLLLRTIDGGASWQRLSVPSGASALSFLTRDQAFVHRPPQFLHTKDAGEHWEVTSDMRDSLGNLPADDFHGRTLSFVDTLNGWAFGDLFYHGTISEGIYHTSDGGFTWDKESEGLTAGPLQNGFMLDRHHGWAVAFDGRVLAYRPLTDAVPHGGQQSVPISFTLEQNYPTPFNPSTTLRFSLPFKTSVTLKVFDLLGRLVATLLESQLQDAGTHQVFFHADGLASGLYLTRLTTSTGFTVTKRMLLLR